MRERIVELSNDALVGDLRPGEKEEWGIGPGQLRTPEELLAAIDRGNYSGGRTGRLCSFCYRPDTSLTLRKTGMWTVDPIDGTKGFLRGEQYAVCLAFIVDARVQLGVIGCPNLPQDTANPASQKGCIFVAVRGQGAHQASNRTIVHFEAD